MFRPLWTSYAGRSRLGEVAANAGSPAGSLAAYGKSDLGYRSIIPDGRLELFRYLEQT